MKKIIAIVMCVFFLLNVVGVSVYAHYCGNKMQETTIAIAPDCCCAKEDAGKANQKDDCCRNEVKVVKIQDNFLSYEKAEIAKLFPVQLFLCAFQFTLNSQIELHSPNAVDIKSPPLRNCSIQLLTQTFLI